MRRLFLTSGLCLALVGCYEDSDVTFYAPHEYLGTADIHTYKPSTHEVELSRRFRAIQTDR